MSAPEPPPSDNDWLRSEDIRTARPPDPRYGRCGPAGYVHRPSDARPPHRCDLPAEWEEGAVWRCPEDHLWIVGSACQCRGHFERHGGRGMHTVGLAWWPATWWQRRRYGGRRAELDMANANRVQGRPRLKPPPASSGTRPPQDYDG